MKRHNKSLTIKQQYLEELGGNLQFFYPEKNKMFLCPVCMKFISLNQKKHISAAHIIPKHAKGKLKTFLCTKCNSNFGRMQDKWFGEFLRLKKKKQHVLFAEPTQSFFHIDDMKLNGTWNVSDQNKIKLIINGTRNSPKTNAFIKNHFKLLKPSRLNLQIPILGKEKLIKIGFLTAAYLLFFATFGYSWALQSYLSPIRKQILLPNEDIISEIFFTKIDAVEDECWLGVVDVLGKYVLAAGFMGYMVLIPTINEPNIYSYLQSILVNAREKNIPSVAFYPMYFTNKYFYDIPVSFVFDDKLMFAPDAYIDAKIEPMTIYFSPSETNAKFLFPINNADYQELSQQPDAEEVKMKIRGKINTKECLYGKISNSEKVLRKRI